MKKANDLIGLSFDVGENSQTLFNEYSATRSVVMGRLHTEHKLKRKEIKTLIDLMLKAEEYRKTFWETESDLHPEIEQAEGLFLHVRYNPTRTKINISDKKGTENE